MPANRALVDFEFFGEGKKYRPRGQLTVEATNTRVPVLVLVRVGVMVTQAMARSRENHV